VNLGSIRCLCLTLFLLFYHPLSLFTQILSELDIIRMNSYLMDGDYSAVENFFSSSDSLLKDRVKNPDERKTYQDVRDRYRYLMAYFTRIDSLSDEEYDKRISQYLTFEDYFQPDKACNLANSYYVQFRKQVQADHKNKALKYYALAFDSKVRHLTQLKNAIDMKVKIVQELIGKDDFKSAFILLKSMEIEKQDTYWEEILNKKFKQLDRETGGKLINYEEALRLKQRTEILRRTFAVNAGLQAFLISSPIYDVQLSFWRFDHATAASPEDVAQVTSRFGISFTFNMFYYISYRYRVGWGVEYGRNYHTLRKSDNDSGTTFNLKYAALRLSVDCLFHQGVGYRPYLGVGLRHVSLAREIIHSYKSTYSPSVDRLVIEGYGTQIPQLCLNFGLEFVRDPKSHYIVDLHVQPYYNLVKSEIIGKFGINMGVRVGGIF
jgi:hypothetical protein